MGHIFNVGINNFVAIYEELKTEIGIGNKCKKVSKPKEKTFKINGLKRVIFLIFCLNLSLKLN